MDVRFEIALGLDHLENRGEEGGDAIVVPRNALVVEPIWKMVLESTGTAFRAHAPSLAVDRLSPATMPMAAPGTQKSFIPPAT